MRLTTFVIASVAMAGAVAATTTSASAAVILEGANFISETGTDSNTIVIQNDDSQPYADVVVNGVDLGSLAVGALSAPVGIGDPTEGSGSPVTISITGPNGFFRTMTATAFDLDRSGLYNIGTLVVPEPSAWVMMLIGFAGLGAAMRTRARTAAAA
jgi:hypothetical protein